MTLIKNLPVKERTKEAATWVDCDVEVVAEIHSVRHEIIAGRVLTVCSVWMSNSSDVIVVRRHGLSTVAIPLARVRTISLGIRKEDQP